MRERGAQSIWRCFTSHHGNPRAAPRANRTLELVGSPIPGATSRRDEFRVCAPALPSQCVFPDGWPDVGTVVSTLGHHVRPCGLLPPTRSAVTNCLAY